MDSTTAWVIVVVVVALVVFALVMGPRLRRGEIQFGKVRGKVEGNEAGPTVRDSEAHGKQHTIEAVGSGATVERTKTTGEGNVIGARTK